MFRYNMHVLTTPVMGPILLSFCSALMIFGSAIGLWHTVTHDPVPQSFVVNTEKIVSPDADRIFGVYQAPLNVAAIEKLALQGIFAASDPRSGAAIIASKGKPGKLYVVGDTLPGGAILKAVRESEIELEVGGQLTVIEMPENNIAGLSRTPAVSPE